VRLARDSDAGDGFVAFETVCAFLRGMPGVTSVRVQGDEGEEAKEGKARMAIVEIEFNPEDAGAITSCCLSALISSASSLSVDSSSSFSS
jgi:hypothetical protein